MESASRKVALKCDDNSPQLKSQSFDGLHARVSCNLVHVCLLLIITETNKSSFMTNGLFKYFSTDQDKLERFTNGQVYLTPPKHLNDPWEFRLRIEPPTDEYLRKQAPWLDPEGMAEFRRRTGSGDWLEEGADEQRELFSRITGLVCLTENPLDQLMWAHYGESHKGFVAEFGPSDDEARTPLGLQRWGSAFGSAAKIDYRPQHPLLKLDQSNMEEVLLTKHLCWKYEDEWRVIRPLHEGDPHPTKNGFVLVWFKPTQLLRVILGLQTSPEVRFQLRQMLSHREFEHVRKEEVHIDPGSRELKSCPLSW